MKPSEENNDEYGGVDSENQKIVGKINADHGPKRDIPDPFTHPNGIVKRSSTHEPFFSWMFELIRNLFKYFRYFVNFLITIIL